MKKLLLLLFVFASFAIQAQYKSMLVDSSYWNVYNTAIGLGFNVSYTDSMYLGDTVSINGVEFWEIRSEALKTYTTDSIYGYAREDTTLGKAWFLKEDTSTTENLIYDLTLAKGDTFRIEDGSIGTIEFEVDTTFQKNNRKYIELTSIAGHSYEMYIYSSPNNYFYLYDTLVFIEGVGSTRGFDNRINSNSGGVIGKADRLLCAYQKNNQVFKHSLGNTISVIKDCYYDFVTGLENAETQNIKINTSPNPTNSIVKLKNTKGTVEKIVVYDILGKQQPTNYIRLTEYEHELNFNSHDNGLYVVEILYRDGTKSFAKIVKE